MECFGFDRQATLFLELPLFSNYSQLKLMNKPHTKGWYWVRLQPAFLMILLANNPQLAQELVTPGWKPAYFCTEKEQFFVTGLRDGISDKEISELGEPLIKHPEGSFTPQYNRAL